MRQCILVLVSITTCEKNVLTHRYLALPAALRRRWHVRLRAHELHLRLLEERCPLGG
jgi:hypothetical protein